MFTITCKNSDSHLFNLVIVTTGIFLKLFLYLLIVVDALTITNVFGFNKQDYRMAHTPFIINIVQYS